MRIPVGSCAGCNQGAKLFETGIHFLGDGKYCKCAFVDAEINEFPNDEFLGVFTNKKKALALARQAGGGLLWIGQSPVEMWAVMKIKDEL